MTAGAERSSASGGLVAWFMRDPNNRCRRPEARALRCHIAVSRRLWNDASMLRIILVVLTVFAMSASDASAAPAEDQALIVAAGKGDLAAVERLIRADASV